MAASAVCACTDGIRRKEIEIRGSFMSSRQAPAALIAMAQSGVLDLQRIQVDTFRLTDIHKAIKVAETMSPLKLCAVEPVKE